MSIHSIGKDAGLLYSGVSLELDELTHWFDHLSAAASNAPCLAPRIDSRDSKL